VGSFDGGAVTSNGGALLLREADRAIGLTRRVCGAIRDGRLQDAVAHALPTLVAQRIHAIALNNYCYLPLYVFDGRHLLLARLRRANIDAAAGAKQEIGASLPTCVNGGRMSRSG
jgi:hypothetical protein